jgi:hypothetical protein
LYQAGVFYPKPLHLVTLQEHELSLIDAIARLAEASDGESGKY